MPKPCGRYSFCTPSDSWVWAFLIPGVVSPDLSVAFAGPAAYGDLSTSILALLALATMGSALGIILVWAFTFSAAQIYAFYEGNRVGLDHAPGLQGAAYFIPTVLVPLLLITHVIVFLLLLKPEGVQVVQTRLN